VSDHRNNRVALQVDQAYVNRFAVRELAAQFDGMMQELIQSRLQIRGRS
jgi:hypothetical protein